MGVSLMAKGALWVKVFVPGRPAHGAYPWEGRNPIVAAGRGIVAIQNTFPTPKKEAWKTTCSVNMVHAGEAINLIPRACEVHLDIRYVPTDDPKQIVRQVRKAFPSGRVTVEHHHASRDVKGNDPHLTLLKKEMQTQTGQPPHILRKHGASDGQHYSAVGTPAICFGPRGAGLHTDSEWVSVKSMVTYTRVMQAFITAVGVGLEQKLLS